MENKKNIFKALADFQQECPVLLKETDGYGYKYIKLDYIIAQINPFLKKHNLGFSQLMEANGLTTILFHHPSGESIQSHAVIPDCSMKGMNVYQSTGSGITYYRRYMLSSMLGIISDADTDAKVYTDSPKKTPIQKFKEAFDLEVVSVTDANTEKTKTKLVKGTKEYDNVVNHIKKNTEGKSLFKLMEEVKEHYIVSTKMKEVLSKLVQ